MTKITFPKPNPDQYRYDKMIATGFEKYPERKLNFERFRENKLRKAKIDYFPLKIDVENVSRCNLKCNMCQVQTFKHNKRAEDMSLEAFRSIIDENIGVYEIKIQGLGEPFLDNTFIEKVQYASKKYIWVRSTTNATILHIHDNYKRIIDTDIGELQVSIDGVSPEVYESIRIGAKHEIVTRNCKLLNEYCDSRGSDKTRMWALLQSANIHELFEFPRFAKELGFKRLTLSLDVNGWGTEKWTSLNSNKKVSERVTQSDIDRLLEIADKIKINLTFWDISDKYSEENLCPWPFERLYVSSDELVVPCCMIGNPDIFSFGSSKCLKDIWHGDKYVKFRNAHIRGSIPEVCKYCYKQRGA